MFLQKLPDYKINCKKLTNPAIPFMVFIIFSLFLSKVCNSCIIFRGQMRMEFLKLYFFHLHDLICSRSLFFY